MGSGYNGPLTYIVEEKRKTELFLERDKDLVGWRPRHEGGGAWDEIQACARRGAGNDPARGASPPNHVGGNWLFDRPGP